MCLDYEIYKEGGILNDRYQKVDDISEGSYGYVSLAKDLKSKKLVAVKYIFKLESNDDDYDSDNSHHRRSITPKDSSAEKKHEFEAQRKSLISDAVKSRFSNNVCFEAMYEVDIQTRVGKHRNIAELLDFFDSYIIMEYCTGGDLYEAIKDDILPRKTKSITYIFSQIMDAVEFVHNKQIFHRDIKPENILITGIDWTIKLTDWGLATTEETSMDRSVGSERYMSPELFDSNLDMEERKEPYTCDKVDLWAMGIVFLNIVFHKNPFSVANQSDKSFCYFAANREALFDVFSTMTYDFFQVLRYCLTIDPTNRDLNKMRTELLNLNEYTLDDEYYNSLEDEYEIPMTSNSPTTSMTSSISEMKPEEMPPSSAPVSLPTPISSSKPLPQIKNDNFEVKEEKHDGVFKKPFEIPRFKVAHELSHNNDHHHYNSKDYNNTNYNHNAYYKNVDSRNSKSGTYYEPPVHRERAKSVPKLKFNRRSRVKNANVHTSIKNPNYPNYPNYNFNYHSKGIKIRNRNKSKILKDSRKPLGIPTPNTHINNYFHDYNKAKDDKFNTRDFFTPPSVQNRYMEGIFDNKQIFHKQQYKNTYLNPNYNNNSNTSNTSTISTNSNNYSKSWNNKNLNSKFRRPSTTGNSAYLGTNSTASRSRHSFTSQTMTSGNVFRRGSTTVQHSPGSYIPPNARNTYYNSNSNTTFSTSPHIPNISSVLDESENGLSDSNNHYSHESAIEDDHDSDDILFSLDESDKDYIHNMNHLSINESANNQNSNKIDNGMSNHHSDRIHNMNLSINTSQTDNNIHANNNNLPDILKSPVTDSVTMNSVKSSGHEYLNIPNELLRPVENTDKPGVYVLPHHRRSSVYSANEAVLSVSPNSISIQNAESKPTQNFKKPMIPITNSSTTVALQDEDIFRYSDNDALFFEDDDDNNVEETEKHQKSRTRTRSNFGPYQIYDNDGENNAKLDAYRSNRRKSSFQDEVVGSLEQYKNNWLMLQQQQD